MFVIMIVAYSLRASSTPTFKPPHSFRIVCSDYFSIQRGFVSVHGLDRVSFSHKCDPNEGKVVRVQTTEMPHPIT